MFSRGAINGSAVDDFAIAGGNFVEEVGASCKVAMSASVAPNRRRTAGGQAKASTTARLVATKKANIVAIAATRFRLSAAAVRRRSTGGLAQSTFNASVKAVRRQAFFGRARARLLPHLVLSHRFLRTAPSHRFWRLPAETRAISFAYASRAIVVPADPRGVSLRDERRSAE